MHEFDSRMEDQRNQEMRAVAQYALEYGRDNARSGDQSGEAPLVAHVKSKTQRQVVREKTPSYAKLSSDRAKEVRSIASARKMKVGLVLDGATAFDVCKQSDCKYAKSMSALESPVLFSTVSAGIQNGTH